MNKAQKEAEARKQAEAEAKQLLQAINEVTETEAEAVKRIEAEMEAEMEAEFDKPLIIDVNFANGSLQVFKKVVENSLNGVTTTLISLWKEAKKVVNASGNVKGFTLGAFTRTFNTSTASLKYNRQFNKDFAEAIKSGKPLTSDVPYKTKSGKATTRYIKGVIVTRQIENVAILETLQTEMETKILNFCLVKSVDAKSENNVLFGSKPPKLQNTFKLFPSVIEAVKQHLIKNGVTFETEVETEVETS